MKQLVLGLALMAGVCAHGETYWAKAAASGKTPPACFVWYSDEACTEQVTVTPKANDGNTYVILGSAKMTGAYTAPVGTHWIFGKDGVNVGTSAARPSFGTNGGVTLNFGEDCVIYGMNVQPNSSGNLRWAGTNTFIKTSLEIKFNVSNTESAAPRGAELCGVFKGESDVVVDFSRGGGQAGGTSKYILSGDFSEYKGKFTASNGATDRSAVLTMSSVSAFGDPTVEATDYLTLNNRATLVIDPKVTQYTTKGVKINLGDSDEAYVSASVASPWTLTAPLAGTKGTLAKTGDGTLTFAGSVGVKKLRVDAGTLVVDSAATFAEGTTLTVKSGAQVVSRLGLKIPNVTVVVEEGGGFSFDFTVPYDGTSVTTLDMTTMQAADWNELSKPVPVQLSQAIVQPLNATNRFAVAKFAAALGVNVTDFKDATPKTYGLPLTWFEVESDGNGTDVVYLVARPAVYLSVSEATLGCVPELLPATQANADEQELGTWSDGLAAHEGADYVVANASRACSSRDWAGASGVFAFPGETLTFVNGGFDTKTPVNRFKRLVEFGGVSNRAQGYSSGDCRHVIEGELELPSGTVSFQGNSGGSGESAHRDQFDVAATVTGAGVLSFTGNGKGLSARFSGDGTGFAGTMSINMDSGNLLAFDDVLSLVADRTVANPRAIYVATQGSGLLATDNTVFEGVNYGIAIQGVDGVLSVAEGKTLTLNGNLRFQDKVAVKSGLGTLALGGNISYQYDAYLDPDAAWPSSGFLLKVKEGWVQPFAWNNALSYRFMRLKFFAGESVGLAIDPATTDADIAKYGMRLAKPNAIQFDTGVDALRVKLLLGEREGRQIESGIVVPVLTVPNELAESLAGKIVVAKNFKYAKATVTSAPADGLDGYTTFTVTLEPSGIVILLR